MHSDFVETIFFHARNAPNNPAISTLGTIVSYRMLAQGILRVEEKIRASGLKQGDTAGILVNYPIGHFAIICALHRLGIASVSIYPDQIASLNEILVDAVLADEQAPDVPVRTVKVDDSWFKSGSGELPLRASDVRPSPDDVARYVLSSGTTGQAKVISLTFRSVQERLESYACRLASPGWERLVCIPSLNTNYGYCFAITSVWLGKMVCFAGYQFARQAVILYQAHVLVSSTQQIAGMVRDQEENYMPLDSLRAVHIGGSVSYAPLIARIRLLICTTLLCGYGSTEAGTVAFAPALRLQGFDNAVGITTPWVRVEVVDENKRPIARGSEGEVRISAYGQGHRYRRVTDSEAEIERGEWFYPGDRGILYKNGMLVILGRLNDIINRGGVKIAPETIEEFAKTLGGIRDAAAVGVLSPLGIEQVWLGIVVDPTVDIEMPTLYAAFREKMPNTVPDRIHVVHEIPRNTLGKIVRRDLQRLLAEVELTTTGTAGMSLSDQDVKGSGSRS